MSGASVLFLAATMAWSLACASGEKDGPPGLFDDHDVDGDGFLYADDCDDSDASVNPDAPEKCDPNDVDEDCDGKADNDDDDAEGGIEAHRDADDDGFGAEATVSLCEIVDGYRTNDRDCDDEDDEINPDAHEVCGGGDEDCDGREDDEDDEVDPGGFIDLWEDADGDGYGGEDAPAACAPVSGQADQGGDCDDDDADRSPAADEVCGGGDEDCDGDVDEDDAADARTWYADGDGDTYGDASEDRTACDAPADHVADDTDCDDEDAGVYPGADETCDDDDEDCDGDVDEGAVDEARWYADSDGDGYGDLSDRQDACDAPSGYVSSGTDCDDTDEDVSPRASERCDSADLDEDCDGVADDFDSSTLVSGRSYYYTDDDGDGFGDPAARWYLCDIHAGYVSDDTDCDDAAATAHPGGTEVCDSRDIDEDCDGDAEDDDAGVATASKSTWYRDADADGYGTSATSLLRCDAPTGYVAPSTDCDDTTASRSPARPEVCDAANLDEDCDELADDADSSAATSGKVTWYADDDGDTYGDATRSLSRCDQPTAYVADATDCDDVDLGVNPGAEEVCFDAVDDDCDGATRCELAFADADRSFYGDSRYTAQVGVSADGLGDIDGDGIDDLVIGANVDSEAASTAGKAYVALGGGSGDADLRVDAYATYRGEAGSSYAGQGVAGAGDVDGDGIPDVVVGVYRDNDGGYEAGAAFIFSGATMGRVQISSTTAWAQLRGEAASCEAGQHVAAAGDVDGDGRGDLLVGAAARSGYTGRTYLVTSVSAGSASLATATAIFNGESASDYSAMAISAAGDVDGDGYGDVLIGAYGDDDAATGAGAAYLVFGPASGTSTLATADAKLTGVARDDAAGSAVSGGDIDGDGYSDVIVAAEAGGTYGAAYLFLGPTIVSASLSAADARMDGTAGAFGDTVAADGDMDGDGRDDIAVGNASENLYRGSVAVFLGPVSGVVSATASDVYIVGDVSYDHTGYSVGYIGSQVGTPGVSDLLVGAIGDDTAASAAGALFVYSASGL
ncbi:MAG: MopE-related protein [Pseudomonadota bacterium]|nr:MopE-related protein [Pseudomonadota bacterium]